MSNGTPSNAPKGINLDTSDFNPEIANHARFIKNLTTAINRNTDGGTPQIAGNNESTRTPLLSNQIICDVDLPEGENYCIGAYNNTNSKETYVHVWNSNSNHTLYKINSDETCEIVYAGSCLNYNLSPEYHIPQNRNELFFKCQTSLFTNQEQYIRNLIFTDGLNWQRFISVNDSIATKSFTCDSSGPTNKFKESSAGGVQFDPCEYIELAPRMPMGCIGIKEIQNTDPSKNNFLLNKTWQFRIKFFDVWNRESEHGIISNQYIPEAGGCKTSQLNPRCLELELEAGSPIVAKIQIEFRNCIGTNTNIPVSTDWYIYETIDKYADCNANANKEWYDRVITLPGYDNIKNTFKYVFCADKSCTPIPVEETNRTENALPIISQALVRVGNGIALLNNEVGYNPVTCDENVLQVEYEEPEASCEPKYCDIEFWAVIHNPFVNTNEPVYNVGGSKIDGGYSGGEWKWGGIGRYDAALNFTPKIVSTNTDYQQTFRDQTSSQQNFFAYLEGTDYKVQGFQQLVVSGVKHEWGGELLNSNSDFDRTSRKIKNGEYYLQHFVFKNVPHGKYIIRISGHNDSLSSDYQNTSTYVTGAIAENLYSSNNLNWSDVSHAIKEFEVNTCGFGGSKFTVTSGGAPLLLLISDLTCPDATFFGLNSKSNVWFGYLKDSENNRVELAPVVVESDTFFTRNISVWADSTLSYGSSFVNKTDHNGFWFCAYTNVSIFSVSVTLAYHVENGTCPTVSTKEITFGENANTGTSKATETNLTVSEDPGTGVVDYGKCRSIRIVGKVVDCNGSPVAGIPVCITRSKSSITNGNGDFSIIIHNDINDSFVPIGRNLPATDRIFISQNGNCIFFMCNSCDMCVPVTFDAGINAFLGCFECDGSNKRTLSVNTTRIRFPFSNQKGLKHGSYVKFGVALYDTSGRHTFVTSNDLQNLYIKSVQEQNNQLFGKVKYSLSAYTFPSWVKYVGIYWTDQQAYYSYLDFVISSVSFNTQTNKIELGFQSIINYNTDNYFKTNTTWEFQKGDRIEFISNEAGVIYDTTTFGILNFLIEGNSTTNNSGIIDFDTRLASLKPGTHIQLKRAKECNTDLFYFECCAPIKLDEYGMVPIDKQTGYLDVWNAYLVSRKIRYSYGGVETVFSFPFLFEHFSPGDTWGGNCGNRGRVNTINPYEQQYCMPMGVALSDSYSTNINGLSRFDKANTHQFDDNGFGEIVAAVTKLNYVLIICSKSAFVTVYDDNTLRVDQQGRVIYTGAKFSKPNPQNRELGCEMPDVSTISQKDGNVMWLDRNNGALVIHNFQATKDVSEGRFYGYLVTKLDTVDKYNNDPASQFIKSFHGWFDNETGEYVLTQNEIPKYGQVFLPPVPSYINTEVGINEAVAETFAYHPGDDVMTQFISFTPEAYSTLNDKLISFKQGKAYMHGIRDAASFNEFYGVKNQSVYDFTVNTRPDLVKFFQWIEVYCKEQLFIADKITTESNQLSEIPAQIFEKVDNFYTSPFLCDKNTFADPNVPELATTNGRLMEGDTLAGKWVRVRLISDNPGNDNYYELQAAVVFFTDIQKSGVEGNPK